MWPSKININQKDGVLSESATDMEILDALLLWDMPLEAYPKRILSAKLVWYIPQELTDDITVDLLLQAFVVPHSDGNYYSFWNNDEFPLGNITLCKNKKWQMHERLQPCNSMVGLGACQTDLAGAISHQGSALAYIPGFHPANKANQS